MEVQKKHWSAVTEIDLALVASVGAGMNFEDKMEARRKMVLSELSASIASANLVSGDEFYFIVKSKG